MGRFNLAIATNTTPDIIWIGAMDLYSWARRGLLVDFNNLISDYERKDMPDWLFEKCSVNGKIVVLPYGLGPSCMAVNLDIAKVTNTTHLLPIDKPYRNWTIEEFEKYLSAIKPYCDENGIILTCIPCQDYFADADTRLMMAGFGAKMFNEDMSECILNSPEGIKAFEWFLHLRDIGLQPSHPETYPSDTEVGELYKQGKVAIYISEGYSVKTTATKVNNILISKPTLKEDLPNSRICVMAIGAFDKGNLEKREYAKLFCKFFADHQGENLKQFGYLPSKKSVSIEYQDDCMNYIQRIAKTPECNFDLGESFKYYQDLRLAFYPELKAAYAGTKTPKQALDDFAKKINELIKK